MPRVLDFSRDFEASSSDIFLSVSEQEESDIDGEFLVQTLSITNFLSYFCTALRTDARKNIEGTPSKPEKLWGIIGSQKSKQRKGEFNALSSVCVPSVAVSSPSMKQKNIASEDGNSGTRDSPNESAQLFAVSSSKKKNKKKSRDSGAEKTRSSKMSQNQSSSNAANHDLSRTKKTKKQKNKRRTFEL